MDLPAVLFVLRWFIRDTLRQARATGVFWALLGATGLCVLLCLSIGFHGERPNIENRPWEDPAWLPRQEAARTSPDKLTAEGVDVATGEMTVLFGAIRKPMARNRADEVRFIQLLLVGGLADTAGVLFALIWTAGFLPGFLESASACVPFAKPVPRWAVLIGKYFGIVLFVALMAALFIGLTWLALGLRTGEWDAHMFFGVPLLASHFAIFFSVSTLLAVITRSTVASVLGTLALWLACWGINFARHAAAIDSGAPWLLNAAYWLLPKPADMGLILASALQAEPYFSQDHVLRQIVERGLFDPVLSFLTSFIIPVIVLVAAAFRLNRTDY